MKTFYMIILLVPSLAQAFNLVGGKYSNLNDAVTARVKGATAAHLNPAGLAYEESSSISSGASAYSYEFSNYEGNTSVTTSSNTSHVATVQATKNYIMAFMLYTSVSLNRNTNSSSYNTNSEGYLEGSSTSFNSQAEENIYIFALAPKKSNWGLSFNIIQTSSSISSRTSTQRYTSTATDRYNEVGNIKFTNQLFSANLAIGQQFKLGQKWSLGYKLSSPTYLLSGKGRYDYDLLRVEGVDANNANVTNINYDIETETVYQTSGEMLKVGISYFEQKWIWSLDIYHMSGYESSKTVYKNKGDYSVWLSDSDIFFEGKQEVYSEGNDKSHNALNLNTSLEYKLSDDSTIGGGIAFLPSSQRGNRGTDELITTIGYSKKYKNFLGSYGINYQKGIDAGNNTTWDNNLQKEVPVKEEFENISFLLSGAYYF